MTTHTSEKGLKTLIMRHMAGEDGFAVTPNTVADPPPPFGGMGKLDVREANESEWLEFKDSYYDLQNLGEYLSAMANGACLSGKSRGYLVFGVENGSHKVVGTRFDPYREKAKGNQDLLIWLANWLQNNVGAFLPGDLEKSRHIRDRGFDSQYYKDLIVALIREHQPISRAEIDSLLMDKLPDVLTAEQRRTKIHNLLNDLAQSKRIENKGSKGFPSWFLVVQAEIKQ